MLQVGAEVGLEEEAEVEEAEVVEAVCGAVPEEVSLPEEDVGASHPAEEGAGAAAMSKSSESLNRDCKNTLQLL